MIAKADLILDKGRIEIERRGRVADQRRVGHRWKYPCREVQIAVRKYRIAPVIVGFLITIFPAKQYFMCGWTGYNIPNKMPLGNQVFAACRISITRQRNQPILCSCGASR